MASKASVGKRRSKPERSDRIAFRAGALLGEIDRRTGSGSRDLTAKRDLARYYDLLRHEVTAIGLSRSEAELICEALAGRTFDERNYEFVWAMIDDAVRDDRPDRKYHVDCTKLVDKVRSLLPCQKLALVDALEISLKRPGDPELLLSICGIVR